jgi:hypothetical protein
MRLPALRGYLTERTETLRILYSKIVRMLERSNSKTRRSTPVSGMWRRLLIRGDADITGNEHQFIGFGVDQGREAAERCLNHGQNSNSGLTDGDVKSPKALMVEV